MKTILLIVGIWFLISAVISVPVGRFFGMAERRYRELTGEDCHE